MCSDPISVWRHKGLEGLIDTRVAEEEDQIGKGDEMSFLCSIRIISLLYKGLNAV